ncbi:MAG: ABC transporter substrate-binding protein, partial [Oscillospiraceae bacterium]|nr:ABC transporter substrate-binding protein [Oscillospiraceae bacterium]
SIFCTTVLLITALAGCNSPDGNDNPNTPPVEGNTVTQENHSGETPGGNETDDEPEPLWTPAPIEVKTLQADPTQTGDLIVYVTPNHYMVSPLIDLYKRMYPNVNVIKEDYLNADWTAFSAQLSVDIAAGKGPDVIFTDSMLNTDIYKVIQAGAFLDLDEFIEQDESFDFGEYVKEVLDAAVFNGKRYVMPYSYTPPIYIANSDRLNDIGFDLSKTSDTVSFLNEIERTIPKAQSNPDYFSTLCGSILGIELLRLSGIQLVDYETNTALPDEDGLKRLFDAYKPYYHIDSDADNIGSRVSMFGSKTNGTFTNGTIIFPPANDPAGFTYFASEMKVKGDYEMMMIPDMDGKIHATSNRAAAIRAGSPNAQNAWNFIKIMLSHEMQAKNGFSRGVPVTKSAIAAQVEEWRIICDGTAFTDAVFKQLTPREAQDYIDMVTKIEYCTFNSTLPPTRNMFIEHMTPYLKDEVSYETALTGLKNQLRLYVSE